MTAVSLTSTPYFFITSPEPVSAACRSRSTSASAMLLKEEVALQVDQAIRNVKKSGWRGNKFKEKEVRIAIKSVLGADVALVESIFEIVKEPQNGY